jgi:hypothetical protein
MAIFTRELINQACQSYSKLSDVESIGAYIPTSLLLVLSSHLCEKNLSDGRTIS